MMLYTKLYIYTNNSEGRGVNSKFWSLRGATNYTGFQPVIKVEVTAFGLGLNIVPGGGESTVAKTKSFMFHN